MKSKNIKSAKPNTSHLVTKEQMDASLRELELRMIIKMGAMLVALGGFMKYFVH